MPEPRRPLIGVGQQSGAPGVLIGSACLPGILAALSAPTAYAGDWTITPRITAQEIYTDNVLLTPTNRRSYFVRRFDGVGTGELRYTYTDTNFSGLQNITAPTPAGTGLQNTSTTTNEATAVFLTGENLGRLQSRVLLDAAETSGTTPSNQLV